MSTYSSQQSAEDYVGLRKQITLSYLRPDCPLPLVVRPAVEDLSLIKWAAANAAFLESYLVRNGAILFRGFGLSNVAEFEELIEGVSGPLLNSYRSTPRSVTSGKICSSTEYPAHQSIPPHNEDSYALSWPRKIWIFPLHIAERGGETPIADSRRVYNVIPAEIRDCFIRRGLMYVRNYGTGLDLPWQDVFQTSSRAVVENYCRQSRVEFEWIGDDQLRTRQRCQVLQRHPVTGATVWFNQAHLFHVSRLSAEVRDWLLAAFGEENLPRNVFFADGSAIDSEMLDEISRAYETQSVVFPWQLGDLLLLDNMLTAHGRNAFTGKREVVVGMTESFRAHQTEQPCAVQALGSIQ